MQTYRDLLEDPVAAGPKYVVGDHLREKAISDCRKSPPSVKLKVRKHERWREGRREGGGDG